MDGEGSPMSAASPWRAPLAALLLLGGWAVPAPALPLPDARGPTCVRERGAHVSAPLLLEFYRELPGLREGDDPREWAGRLQTALASFRKKVAARYGEATLQRLLDCPDATVRKAAVLALGQVGTMGSNQAVAARLHDDDPDVRQLASDALWSIWFRADTEANARELQRLLRLRDGEQAVAGLDELIRKAPGFAEAYNQRAIRSYQAGDYRKAVADCEKVLQLNPHHFGAQSGMAQAYLQLRQPRQALKAFRAAHKTNPNLEGVEETIRALEHALGDDGKK
jgi:tetratricopeptide (TPR) repeat protein